MRMCQFRLFHRIGAHSVGGSADSAHSNVVLTTNIIRAMLNAPVFVYLDQFALSNLEQVRAGQIRAASPWFALDEALSFNVQHGPLACPVSEYHLLEASPFNGNAKNRLAISVEYSGGWAFRPLAEIVRFQTAVKSATDPKATLRHFCRHPHNLPFLPVEDFTHHLAACPEWKCRERRQIAANIYATGFQDRLWKNWCDQDAFDRTLLREEEWRDLEAEVSRTCWQLLEHPDESPSCLCSATAPLGAAQALCEAATSQLPNASAAKRLARIGEMISGGGLRSVPFFQCQIPLCSELARKAQYQRKVPKKTIWNDIDFISAYSPFIDYMLVDRECAELIKQAHLPVRCQFGTTRDIDRLVEMMAGGARASTSA